MTEEVAARFRAAAEDLVERFPAADLDYGPASLARLDRVAEAAYDGRDLSAAELDGEDADSRLLTDLAREAGGYFGAVLCRAFGGEWRDDDGPVVVAQGDGRAVRVDTVAVAADALRGTDSFAATYETLDRRLSPADDDGPDPVIDRFAARAAAETAAEDSGGDAAAVAEEHEAAAATLAEDWPAYDLDRSVTSLAHLDTLVAREFDRSGGDREYAGDPLTLPPDAMLSIPTDGSVERFGGYLAAVLRHHHGATWRVDGDDATLVVEGPADTVELDPWTVAVACFAGESSFVDAYARVAADAGLTPPLG